MLSVEEARARILSGLTPVGAEICALSSAWGRVPAEPVIARLTQPPTDTSAMDGYALRANDAAKGAKLRIVGAAPAGRPFDGVLKWGESVRLFTGSVLPAGADCVLLQEDATLEGDAVLVNEAPTQGQHIRRKGQDFSIGDVLLPAGQRLSARDIGLAAAANYPWLKLHRRPRVAILATGDEISLPGESIGAGGIVSSNSHALAAMARALGAAPTVLPVARDNAGGIAAAVAAARGMDLLVTTGGASVGDHDLVQQGLNQAGFSLDFWKIAMRPGKPMIYGSLGDMPVLGLPGNPVSAFVCAILFMLPALQRLAGLPATPPETEIMQLGTDLRANDQRADHLRATLARDAQGNWVATPFPRQDSGMLTFLAHAGGLILRAPHAPALAAGALVEVIRLDRLGV